MFVRVLKRFRVVLLLLTCSLQPFTTYAKVLTPLTSWAGQLGDVPLINWEIYVKGLGDAPIEGAAVTLTRLNGQLYGQGTTAKTGYIRFDNLPRTEYTLQVAAPAYDSVSKRIDAQARSGPIIKVSIELRRVANVEDAESALGLAMLAPKAQTEMGKALKELRDHQPSKARRHLEAAYHLAPTSAEVNFVFGVCASQLHEPDQAESHWTKTLEFQPRHLNALLSLSQLLLHENKPEKALPLLRRAATDEPSSWRVHALLAQTFWLLDWSDEAIEEAERALKLDHVQAAVMESLLAAAFAARGETARATSILEAFLIGHPENATAKQQLASLQNPKEAVGNRGTIIGNQEGEQDMEWGLRDTETSLLLPSNWLPPGVDEEVPPVDPAAACAIDDVLQKAGERVQEFATNVDRFTATEDLKQESINRWGSAFSPQTRKFDYMVSVEDLPPGRLHVEEFRNSHILQPDFPDGVATKGLPALVLIFHPYNVGAFDMTCEGLARKNGTLGWQVHFRQRGDKPNLIRAYRSGVNGKTYPVALKGRAWIAADTYQILRLETELMTPLPQIRLATDRTVIEYGPVHFLNGKLDMWLPQSAEVYYDWRGRRSHRRHSFSNYLLFAVEDNQRITVPKIENVLPPNQASPPR
jgi:tetratricopeptide (TPR) repeat protein